MKPHYYRDSEIDPIAGSTTPAISSASADRARHAANARTPPVVAYRRYPSLSDDGQPYFPRLRRLRLNTSRKPHAPTADESPDGPLFSVRAFAFLAIVVIIAILAATA